MTRIQTVHVLIDKEGYNSQIIQIIHRADLASIHHIIVETNDTVIVWINNEDTLFSQRSKF